MERKFCILVFAHADTENKKIDLKRSLISLSFLELPIILSSHIPVDGNIKNLATYTLEENNNLILDESEILSNPVEINTDLYKIEDEFNNLKFYTSIFKKTYTPAVINHYIKGVKFIKELGFTDILIWEYDSILGFNSSKFLKNMIRKLSDKNLEYLGFSCLIQGINSIFSVPAIYNINALEKFVPTIPIENAIQYNNIVKMKFSEQWMCDNLTQSSNGELLNLESYDAFFYDTQRDTQSSQNKNLLFSELRSGIYFEQDTTNTLYYIRKPIESKLDINITIKSNINNSVIWNKKIDTHQYIFCYYYLGEEMNDHFLSEKGVEIEEIIFDNSNGKEYKFLYTISKYNIDFCKKLKNYKKITNNE